MLDILNVVLPTFIVIIIGFIFGRFRKVNIAVLVDVVFYVGLPALAFTSMLDKKIVLSDAAKVWASALIIMLGCLLVAGAVFKALRRQHSGLYLPITILNSVNIPFPIISLAFGSAGLAVATLFYIPNSLLLYTLGIYLVAGKHWRDSIKEIARVPAIYAAVAGLIVNLLNLSVPDLLLRPLVFISPMTIPLVLLVLGFNLSRVKVTSVPTTLLASFLRIGVGLAFGFLVVSLFDLTGVTRAVIILDSAMPSAANTVLLAVKYDNEESELVSSVVFVTTVASLLIIPFLLSVLSH